MPQGRRHGSGRSLALLLGYFPEVPAIKIVKGAETMPNPVYSPVGTNSLTLVGGQIAVPFGVNGASVDPGLDRQRQA